MFNSNYNKNHPPILDQGIASFVELICYSECPYPLGFRYSADQAVIFQGYFLATETATFSFIIGGSQIYLWTGSKAFSQWTQNNADATANGNGVSSPDYVLNKGDILPITVAVLYLETVQQFGVFSLRVITTQNGVQSGHYPTDPEFLLLPLDPTDLFPYHL